MKRSTTAISSNGNGANHSGDLPTDGGLLRDRVRDLRREKGWTLEELAGASGVSRSMISQIERNEANPTIGVAHRIAAAFGLSLSEFFEETLREPAIDVIRLDDRGYHYRTSKDCRIRSVTPSHLEKDVEFYEVALKSGAALRSVPHFAGTREFLTVHQGSIRIHAGDERAELHRGDAAHYPADVPHSIENIGKADAVVFLVEIYRRAGS